MGFFNRNTEENMLFPDTNDILIVFDHEKKTSDIRRINSIDAEKVYVDGLYAIPILDCEITNSVEGRHFFYRAPSQSVEETKRLAKLEKSIVLEQLTNFKPKIPPKPDMMKGVLLGMVALFGILAIIT